MQNDLLNILIRFRQHAIAISADIAKMYCQVDVNCEGRSLQQIFLRKDPSLVLDIFRLNTMTAYASFLAIYCHWQLACENNAEHATASNVIKNYFCVDDLLTGVETVEEVSQLIAEISNILKSDCFLLRKGSRMNQGPLKRLTRATN